MKLVLSSRKVLATRLPTLTCAPAPNSTPLGLRMKTCPLAVKLPSRLLGLLPVMRFRAMAWALGWLKTRASLAVVESLSQSMARRWLVWVMVVVAPCVTTLPLPALTRALAALAASAGGGY